MTVRKAKKILKAIEHDWPNHQFYYAKVKWDHKRQVFICDTHCGQRSLVIL